MSVQDNQTPEFVETDEGTSTTVGYEINRITTNIQNAYDSLAKKGVLIEKPRTSDWLQYTITNGFNLSLVSYVPDTRTLTITTSLEVRDEN
jgi:hypothetical protein